MIDTESRSWLWAIVLRVVPIAVLAQIGTALSSPEALNGGASDRAYSNPPRPRTAYRV